MKSNKEKYVYTSKVSACWLLSALAMFAPMPASYAAPASDAKAITVRVVIPPRVNTQVFRAGEATAQDYSVCIAGSGVGQFRLQKSGDNPESGYSPSYPVHTGQLKSCTRQTTTPILGDESEVSGSSVVMIAAE